MKKKKLKDLFLNKKVISELNASKVIGGAKDLEFGTCSRYTESCTEVCNNSIATCNLTYNMTNCHTSLQSCPMTVINCN